MDTKIKNRAFGIGDIFSTGWQFYRQNFLQILPAILCIYIPINIILLFIPVDTFIENYGPSGLRLYQSISKLLELFLGSIATVALAYLVETTVEGQETSWRESLRYGISRWTSVVGTNLLAGLIILGLTLLLIIPGIIWSGYYTFCTYVAGLRNIGGKTALDYSKKLVKGQWWRVFGIQFVIGLAGSVVSLGIGLLSTLLPDNQLVQLIYYSVLDIVNALFTVMFITFFLNTDYLRNPLSAKANEPPDHLKEINDQTV